MTVVYFHRKPMGQHSVEEYFASVRAHLPGEIQWRIAEASRASRGVWPRVVNLLEAVGRQGDVNHITGDIHYVAFGLRRRRTILTILDCGFEQREPGWRREWLRRIWFAWPERRVAQLTAISQFTKNRLIELIGCAPDRIAVVPVCVPAGFRPSSLGVSTQRPVVLQVGTKPNKNLERLAGALRGMTCELRIIGQTTAAQRAELAANGVRYTEAHGLTSAEVVQEYERAAVVAFASTYEGFGMPIVEAQAVGRPVLTSRVTSMPEVAGDAAWLVNPYDVESIRDGIGRLLTDVSLRERLVERGFQNVRRFAPATVARAYVDLYHSVASAP